MTLLPRSIAGRLVFWFFVCTTVVLISVGMLLYAKVGNIVVSSVDRTLHSKLQIITGLLHEERGSVELELSEIIAGEYVIPRSGHYYKVMMGKDMLAVSPSMAGDDFNFVSPPPVAVVNQLGETFYTGTGPDNEPVRVISYEYSAFGKSFTITLAESLKNSYSIIVTFRRFLQVSISLSIILLCLTAWLIARMSLRPLAAFSSTIETITHKNLTEHIDAEATANELTTLARSFNALLDRLNHVFESQKRLVADASHGLKTPLSVIRTQCDVVQQRPRTPEEYMEAFQTIRTYSQNMTRLINNLLSLARLDAGFLSMGDFTAVSLRECIEQAVLMTAQFAEEHSIQITTSIDGTILVKGSQTGLLEAFLNIIENGVRYNREGGAVSISGTKKEGKALITIADTGSGISENDISGIFKRFYRGDNAQDIEGTGLGLSIVRSIISAHGGEIYVRSEPGVGSRFTVVLPAMDVQERRA
jgi:signal transduction histidine kinase